jgi:aldehyde:ferredoxin oxidoreductase
MAEHFDPETLRARHKVLARWAYEPARPERGYTGKCLRVDVGKGTISEIQVTQEMKDRFVGGKGFDLRLMWDEVSPQTRWDSPENAICISSGPLGGTTTFSGAGKSLVTAISPLTGIPIDSNVGGYFGPLLKFSGFDALVVVGIAREEVLVVIDATVPEVRIETAPGEAVDSHVLAEQLTRMFGRTPNDFENVSVVSSGSGAAHARMGCLNFSWWDWRRRAVRFKQAGRGGIGTVLRHKRVKALVVHARPWKNRWTITLDPGPLGGGN